MCGNSSRACCCHHCGVPRRPPPHPDHLCAPSHPHRRYVSPPAMSSIRSTVSIGSESGTELKGNWDGVGNKQLQMVCKLYQIELEGTQLVRIQQSRYDQNVFQGFQVPHAKAAFVFWELYLYVFETQSDSGVREGPSVENRQEP